MFSNENYALKLIPVKGVNWLISVKTALLSNPVLIKCLVPSLLRETAI